MPATVSSEVANQISAHFDGLGQKIFKTTQLGRELSRNRSFWAVPRRIKVDEFVDYLIEKQWLTRAVLRSEEYNKEVVRYTWGVPSIYELALSVRSTAYLSHGTA